MVPLNVVNTHFSVHFNHYNYDGSSPNDPLVQLGVVQMGVVQLGVVQLGVVQMGVDQA